MNSPASRDERPREAAPRRHGTWSTLAYPQYRLLWLATIAAIVTSELRLVVTGVWLYEETGSAAQLGFLGLIQLVVQIPALLFGGTLADRLDRRLLTAWTQFVTLVFVAGMAVLAVTDVLLPWHVYLATAALSVSSVFGNPARAALVSATVPPEQMVDAVTTNFASQQIATVVAPLGFAALAETVSLDATFVATAIVAIPAVILPLMMRTTPLPAASASGGSLLRRTWEGLQFVKVHPLLPALYLMDTGVTVVSFYRQMYPVFADQLFDGGAGTVGLLTAANSIGAIGGSFAVLALRNVKRTGMLVLIAHFLYALLLFPFALNPWLPLGLVLLAGLGGMDAITVTVRQATVQLTTPDEMRGRALSVQTLSAQTANNVGTLWVGMLSALIGASSTLVLGGGLSMLFTGWVWQRVKAVKEYRAP
jgi:predicted MFS family arabinose efflux permease